MKKILLSLTVLAVTLGFTACKKKDNAAPTTASVMFVHGCAAGSTPISVDAKANGTAVSNGTSKAFLQNTGYQQVTAGSAVSLQFAVSGLSALCSGTGNLAVGSHYTAFAGGTVLAPSFVLTTDDLTAPASGNVKIRFANLSNDTLKMTANAQNTAFATAVTSQQVSAFTEIAAGTYAIKAGDPTNINSVIALANASQQLSAGKIYTVMLTGTLSGTGSSVLTLTLINNN